MSSTAVPTIPTPPPLFAIASSSSSSAAAPSVASSSVAPSGPSTVETTLKKRIRWMKERRLEADNSRSRDVTGCKVWKNYSEIQRGGLEGILSHFQTACSSPEFSKVWTENGFGEPTFYPNRQLSKTSHAHRKFEQGLKTLDLGACLGVVFHGTSKHNISAILQNGLDPQRRKGQAYGPGEYFSKNPAVSVGYCHGGLEMLVFVVALPSTLPSDSKVQKDPNQKQSAFLSSQAAFLALPPSCNRKHRIPQDYVVVENNHHQIPIGTMKFTHVNQSVMTASQSRRAKFLALSRDVFQKEQISKETRFKATIIQDLIANKIDLASEQYQKHYGNLSFVSRREISWYAHQKVDEDVVSFYFPGLPDPFGADEIETVALQSLDDATKQEQEAKERLEAERQKEADAQNGPQQVPGTNLHDNPVLYAASAASRASALAQRRHMQKQQRRHRQAMKQVVQQQQSSNDDAPSSDNLQGILNPTQALSHTEALSQLLRNHAQNSNASGGFSLSQWTVPVPAAAAPPPPPQYTDSHATLAAPLPPAGSSKLVESIQNRVKAEAVEVLFPRLPPGRAAEDRKRKHEEEEEEAPLGNKSASFDSDVEVGSAATLTVGNSGASSGSSSGN